jgi:hypothetical protein
MLDFNFVETPNTTGKVIDTITLTANDYLSFPTFFTEKNKLKDKGSDLYARLYFDKSKFAIAIQFSTEKMSGLYKVNVSTDYGATCKIKSFLLNNEISTSEYADKYEYKKYSADSLGLSGDDIYVIDLRQRAKLATGAAIM